MKKTIFLLALLLSTGLASFAQTIENPAVDHRDNQNLGIKKIETDKQFTVVTFEYTAFNNNTWMELNKGIYIQTDVNNERYDYIKSESISFYPVKDTLRKAGDTRIFKVFFRKIPAETKSIDIIERAGGGKKRTTSFFNFYDVSLTQTGQTQQIRHADITLMPPPPAKINDIQYGMTNAMSAMGPMFSNIAKSVMDAQLDYYKQPGKIAELAHLHKQYFDALVKEGFTYEQAIKIITADSIAPKASSLGGK